jgi:hypothetical protein
MCKRTLNQKIMREIKDILKNDPCVVEKILLDRFRDAYFTELELNRLLVQIAKTKVGQTRRQYDQVI